MRPSRAPAMGGVVLALSCRTASPAAPGVDVLQLAEVHAAQVLAPVDVALAPVVVVIDAAGRSTLQPAPSGWAGAVRRFGWVGPVPAWPRGASPWASSVGSEVDGDELPAGTRGNITLEENTLGDAPSAVAARARRAAFEDLRGSGLLPPIAATHLVGEGTGAAAVLTRRPTRLGRIEPGARDETPRWVVVADRRGPATELVAALTTTGAAIAVAHRGGLRALRLELRTVAGLPDAEHPATIYDAWMEVRVLAGAVEVEVVPGPVTALAWPAGTPLDGAALTKALAAARAGRDLSARRDVDVLVDTAVDAGRLVEVLDALDQADLRQLGLGTAPAAGSEGAAVRGRAVAHARLGPIHIGGQPGAPVRPLLEAALPALRRCASSRFGLALFIDPRGQVTAIRSDPPAQPDGVEAAVRAVAWPPARQGGLQVSTTVRLEP